jgi:two-component system sensor histidine kinase UhpB
MSKSDQPVLHSYLKPKINILHVEDDRTNALFIHSVLDNIPGHEFSIFTVTSLTAAAAELAEKLPDLILLDLTVDDSSGLETLDRMRNIAPLIPIVITTGDDSQKVLQTAIRRGAQDYLLKNNINQDILNRTICNAIDRKIAENEMHAKNLVLETIMESNVVGYWDWFIHEKRRVLSPELKRMLGYAENELSDSAQELQGLLHPDDQERVAESFKHHVQSRGKTPYQYVARFRHEKGSFRWLGCRGKVVSWSRDYLPIRMIGCYIDFTALETERDALLSVRNFSS